MPVRTFHDLLGYLLETSEIIFPEQSYDAIENVTGFTNIYLCRHPFLPRFRRKIKYSELKHLSVQMYREFMESMILMVQSNQSIDVDRRFKGVRVVDFTRTVLSDNIFECDVEFEVSTVNFYDEDFRGTYVRTMECLKRGHLFSVNDSHEDVVIQRKPAIRKNRKESYFDEDLFKL